MIVPGSTIASRVVSHSTVPVWIRLRILPPRARCAAFRDVTRCMLLFPVREEFSRRFGRFEGTQDVLAERVRRCFGRIIRTRLRCSIPSRATMRLSMDPQHPLGGRSSLDLSLGHRCSAFERIPLTFSKEPPNELSFRTSSIIRRARLSFQTGSIRSRPSTSHATVRVSTPSFRESRFQNRRSGD